MDINKLIDQAIQEKMKSTEILKHVRGTVVSFDEDCISVVVDVYGKQVTVINKSGEELSEGDEVTIHYWTNISNGYIAVRHGISNLKSGSLTIDRASILTTRQNSLIAHAQELVDTDKENNVIVNYGDNCNRILVNGYFVSPLTAQNINITSSDFKNMVNTVPNDLLYQEITLIEFDTTNNAISTQRYYTMLANARFSFYNGNYTLFYTPCGMKEGLSSIFLKTSKSWQYNCASDTKLALFYSSIHAPSSGGISNYFTYGYADLVMVMKCRTEVLALAEVTCGFASQSEYEYALSVTARSEVEKL